ncbi:Flavin monooxygenase-like [Dillenia turbinata]|uniref:Flavin-containing monooxygenase n=1 Tax=Dillenia turbinata TaxID=194707 RepID=A0AAN8ZHE5_9MAGN
MGSEQNPLLVSKIGIIGAGISGIAAAKELRAYKPFVFEATDSIGGVWKHCSYNSTKLQSLRCDYEFSDYPWPERDNMNFPSHLEILEYLHSYANHFDVMKLIHFNTKVVEIRLVRDRETIDYGTLLPGQPVWKVAVKTNQSETLEWYAFEFLVICIGKYGDIPKMPEFPQNKGPEVFKGKVMHSLEYCKLDKEAATELVRGKKAIVVGYKKSGIDLAMECAEANQGPEGQPCTMVKYAVSKFVESYLTWKLPLDKYGLRPEHPFLEDYASCQMAILPENFFEEADKGTIRFKRAFKWWFWDGGIEFEDNTKLEADIVFLSTGFDGKKKLKTILPEPFRSLLEYPSGLMPLYRATIHPLIPNMAFVGYIESVANLHSAELRCKWLSGLMDGLFKLPSVEKMLEDTTKEIKVMKSTTRFYKRHCISTYSINHDDEICEDMGWASWRKKSWIAELFSPYTSQDYEEHK